MATETQRHIIQTIFDRTGIEQYRKETAKAQRVASQFGYKVAESAKYAGTTIQTSFNKAGDVVTKKTATFVKGGKQMKVAWQESAKGATALGVSTTNTGQALSNMNTVISKAIKRALVVAPIWLAIRGAMMLAIRTVREAIQAYIDLDDALARIRTVMHGTKESIETEMIAIKNQIIEASLDSRLSIKDLAEGFYFLKTANLSATESMEAFQPTVDLAIGTMNSMGESARAVAGIYNTMGQYLGDNLTIHEKFQKIADVLAYTYSTQDVQLGELIQSYTKLAPYVTGLSDNFTELTTMLGFLNTRLLRAGRTGRLTGRAILQLTKNAEKLARIFDITFEADAPIDFLNTIRQIRDSMGKVGKITAEQGDMIQEVFATRAGVVIRLLIEHFDDLSDQIKDAIENADGFAKKMKELRMQTIAGQIARTKNILAVLTEEFLTSATGAKNLADSISNLNDKLNETHSTAKFLGRSFSDIGEGIRIAYYQARAYIEVMKELNKLRESKSFIKMSSKEKFQAEEQARRKVMEVFGEMYMIEVKQRREGQKEREEYIQSQEKIKQIKQEQIELANKRFKLLKEGRLEEAKDIEKSIDLLQKKVDDLQPAEIRLQTQLNKSKRVEAEIDKDKLSRLDKIEEKEKSRIRIMKVLGATALDIASAELQILENSTLIVNEREHELELLRARLKVNEEEIKYRDEIVNKFRTTEMSLLKTIGASELQLLNIQEKQLKARRAQIQPIAFANSLLDIQLQKEIGLQNQIMKRRQLFETVMDKILKAEGVERESIREAVEELLPLSGDAFANVFSRLSEGAKKMAGELKSIFTKEQQEELLKARIREAGFDVETIAERIQYAIERQPEMSIQKMRAVELLIDKLQIKHADGFDIGAIGRKRGETGEWENVMGRRPITNIPLPETFQFKTDIKEISLNITQNIKKEGSKREIIDKTVNDIADAIRTDPNVRKALDEKIEQF